MVHLLSRTSVPRPWSGQAGCLDRGRIARVMKNSGDHDVACIAEVLKVSRASVYRALGPSAPVLESRSEQAS